MKNKNNKNSNEITKEISTEYNYGIELFRIFSMLMIIIIHMNLKGGLLGCFGSELNNGYKTVWFGEAFCFCCVNCYALISGFVMYNRKATAEKLIKTHLQVFSISAVCAVIFLIINDPNIPRTKITDCFFPLIKQQYWYFVAYYGMYLLIPFFNAAIEKMERKTHRTLCFIIFVFYTVLPISISADIFRHSNGMSVFWLSLMYIVGAYFGKYGVPHPKYSPLKAILLALLVGIIYAVTVIYHSYTYSLENGSLGDQFKYLFYTHPLSLLEAILFLMAFSQLKFKNDKVKKILKFFGASSFSVYLIHVNPLIFDIVFAGKFTFLSKYNFIVMALMAILCAMCIYVVCTLADKIRILILKITYIDRLPKYIAKAVTSVFDLIVDALS